MSTPPDSFSSAENHDEINRAEEEVSPSPLQAAPPTASPTGSSEPEQAEPIVPTISTVPITSEPTSIAELPPEAQGEVNGGPLGCCLGTMIGMLLSLSIALVSRFYADPLASTLHNNLSTVVRIIMIIVAVVAVIICGYFGWKIGKRIYREYDEPRVTSRSRRTRR